MTTKKIVYLDMDGTIADLYNLPNWLERLQNEDKTIFEECKPLVTMEELNSYYPLDKYELRICSMTPKGASANYRESVKAQKNAWLDKFFPYITHRVYMTYGHSKNLRNSKEHILIDDNKTIRDNYKGLALYPQWL